MKIVEINAFNIGSTGRIMLQLKQKAEQCGNTVFCFIPAERINIKNKGENQILIGSILERQIHLKLGKLTGYNDCFSYFSTKRLIKKIDKIKPDLIHLHNIHNCYLNFNVFFEYIKKSKVNVVWTFHDCWPFTGRCPHFVINNCQRWKQGCNNCSYSKSEYPYSLKDRSHFLWKYKKRNFTGIDNLKIVTPSHWMKELVDQSFMKDYESIVINNGIDLTIFRPLKSNFRLKYGLSENNIILLGVAFDWNYKKGLNSFIKLAKDLNDNFKIILVGTNKEVDEIIPSNIISIRRTNSQQELAEIYSAADYFINPTLEDTFSLVNIEALACGTPVITFNTGGCAESITDECGYVIEDNTYESLLDKVKTVSLNKCNMSTACRERAKLYDNASKYKEYIKLYEKMVNENE